MSDYEGEGERWNPVDLSNRQDPARISAQAFTDHVAPRGQLLQDPAKDIYNTRRDKRSLGNRPARTFHPLLQNIRPKAHHGTGGRPVDQAFFVPSANQHLESYNLFEENPDQPSDVYELDISWKGLLRAITETAEFRSREIARNNLDNISVFSEAFIKTPDPDSMRVEIWGTKEQCEKAKVRLQAWEGHLRQTGTRPSQKTWIKENAYDGRKEDRKRQQLWQELEDQALQEADDSDFEYEAYLVWPQDYDLNTYIKKYEANTLKEIGKEFSCRFKHNTIVPRFTKVQAQSQDNLLSAYQRLINLVKEMVSQRNRGTHGNFCCLPSPNTYRDQVVPKRIADTLTSPFRIVLCGSKLTEDEADQWLDSLKLYQKQNLAEMQSSIDTFIKSLYVSQCYIRLRVSFGEVLLKSFPKAKGGGLKYAFDEFLTMMQGRRTVFSDPTIQEHQGDMASLVDKLSRTDQFKYPEESYRQIFEFKGSDVTNRLRLEIEMQPGYDFDEPQVCSQRWLTFKTHGQNENVLGLRMFDFERPGYMIRADAYDLHTNDSTIKDMEAFRSAVSFKPARDGLKAYPKLRSTFPGHSKLIAVNEFISVKYQFKDTDGIVELRREDVYMQNTSTPSKLPNNTRFELFYYYPEWDHLLGELSNITPGGNISWHRDLMTFFPNHIDLDRPRSLPKGFKTFMKEVRELQDLLKEVMSE